MESGEMTFKPDGGNPRIGLLCGRRIKYYPIRDLIRIETLTAANNGTKAANGEGNYVRCYFAGGVKVVICKKLIVCERLLEKHGFIRIHNQHLVNHEHIDYLNLDDMQVQLTDGSIVGVSSGKKEALLNSSLFIKL